jgi:hypothetical protein
MLQSRLIKDIKADAQADAKRRAEAAKAEAERAAEREPAYRCKSRVENIVYRVAGARHPGAEPAVTRVIREAGERLDDEDLYGDLLERPLSEIVARICRDLGLEPDWAELAQEWWAVTEIESGDVGWPLRQFTSEQTRPLPLAGGEGAMANDLAIEPNDREAVERAFSFDTA